mmetsp:Transcript_1855/g.2195  ORF Transcript_1855/g.2195 Transcript_1855/m.2195 type:complete len:212 (-) Transcript_1855:359-994(-)
MMYNSVWTSWACLCNWAVDEDVSRIDVLMHPSVYTCGQNDIFFSTRIFLLWVAFGLLHGSVAFFLVFYGLCAPSADGVVVGFWWQSCVMFSWIVLAVNLKLCVEMLSWNRLQCLTIIATIGLFWGMVMLLSQYQISKAFQWEIYWIFYTLSPMAWILLLCTPLLLIFDILKVTLEFNVWPSQLHKQLMASRATGKQRWWFGKSTYDYEPAE